MLSSILNWLLSGPLDRMFGRNDEAKIAKTSSFYSKYRERWSEICRTSSQSRLGAATPEASLSLSPCVRSVLRCAARVLCLKSRAEACPGCSRLASSIRRISRRSTPDAPSRSYAPLHVYRMVWGHERSNKKSDGQSAHFHRSALSLCRQRSSQMATSGNRPTYVHAGTLAALHSGRAHLSFLFSTIANSAHYTCRALLRSCGSHQRCNSVTPCG